MIGDTAGHASEGFSYDTAPAESGMRSSAMRVVVPLAIFCLFAPLYGQDLVSPETLANTINIIGVSRDIDRIRQLSNAPPTPAGSPQLWQNLWLHQRVNERINSVGLQVDAIVAQIDNEIAGASEIRSYLSSRRDHTVNRANLLSALLGGGLSATSAGLQLSPSKLNATVATGIVGGTISTGLAVYGIQAQQGKKQAVDSELNMLAPFFERKASHASTYPPVIWRFFSEVPPVDPEHLSRHDRLIHTWVSVGRIHSLDDPADRAKIDRVTSLGSQHIPLSIDDLETRVAMLHDVRAMLLYLKRDLAAVIASLPPMPVQDMDMPEPAK
jgi:hypothetical protein